MSKKRRCKEVRTVDIIYNSLRRGGGRGHETHLLLGKGRRLSASGWERDSLAAGGMRRHSDVVLG